MGADNLPASVEDHSGVVVLPDLPAHCQHIVDVHNRLVLADYVRFVHAGSVEQINSDKAASMPLSGATFPAHDEVDDSATGVLRALREPSIQYAVCSPFVATSGRGDSFRDTGELLSAVNSDMHLDPRGMPILNVGKVSSDNQLNAYLVDYFAHEQMKVLIRDNGLHPGDAWQSLKDFTFTLKYISDVLWKYAADEEGLTYDPVAKAVKRLSDEYKRKYDQVVRR